MSDATVAHSIADEARLWSVMGDPQWARRSLDLARAWAADPETSREIDQVVSERKQAWATICEFEGSERGGREARRRAEDLFVEGERALAAGETDRGLELLEKSKEIIDWAPYELDLHTPRERIETLQAPHLKPEIPPPAGGRSPG